jgi:serine/threonine protein kinase
MESAGPGRLIAGRYRLNAVIGRGGMGLVWRARDELLDRDVAVKELAWPAYFSEQEQRAARQCAAREAQAAARVSHPNVIRIFDVIEEDGSPWIVMELLPRGSLHDLIEREGPLSPAQAATVGLGILAALRAAHAEGIVHRDVKPANILMAEDRVVLTDFGIAQAAGASALTTAVDVLIGSPAYIAPERARGRQCGPPADLWGLGASLYAAVEGRGPFDRDGDALASLAAVVADEPPPATHAGPLLWPMISGLLRKDPGKRPSAAEAEEMLRRAAAPAGAVASRPRRAQVLAASLVGSAALAVLTVSGLVLTSPPRHQTASVTTIAPPAAASPRPPAASRPSPAASKRPKAPAQPHLAARTSQTHAPRSSAPAENTGNGAVTQDRAVRRTGNFAYYPPGHERRAHGTHREGRPSGAGHAHGDDQPR